MTGGGGGVHCPGGGRRCPGGYLSRGVSVREDLCPGGSLFGGSLSKGVSVREDLCPAGSLLGSPPIWKRVGGTHPTGMHSCLLVERKSDINH